MNYIAASFLTCLKDAEMAFDLFMALISERSLIPLFRSQVPEFHLRQFVLNSLIKENLPQLHGHFRKVKLEMSALTGSWLMPLFHGFLSHQACLAVMDNFFQEGWPAIYKVALAILRMHEADFLKLDELTLVAQKVSRLREDVLTVKTFTLMKQAFESEQFLGPKKGNGFPKLVELEHEYFKSQVEFKLGQPKGIWTNAESTLLPALMSKLKKREEPIKKEVKMQQAKIKAVEAEMGKALLKKKTA